MSPASRRTLADWLESNGNKELYVEEIDLEAEDEEELLVSDSGEDEDAADS
jgi:hypothetical protein